VIFLLKMLALAFGLYIVLTLTLSFIAVRDSKMRALFSLTALLAPFLFAWSLVRLALGGYHHIKPFDPEVGRVEDEIEAVRVKIFGVAPLKPSFSHMWQMGYRKMLEKTYNNTERLRSFASTAVHGHRVA
jgi:hypothetical protein